MHRGAFDETGAWTALGLNALVLPGLGSFLVGRRVSGVLQAVAALVGAALCLWWLMLLAQQWMADGAFPIDGGESFRVGVIGVLVFGAGWVWSLATGIVVLRAIKVSRHRDTKTQRTEGERNRQKRDDRYTEEKTRESRAGEKTSQRETRERASQSRARERDFLVTGTDTGVGKTVVAAGLVLALRARGRRAIGFKPVETGVVPGEVADSALLARAAGREEPLALPLRSLREALAPAVASDRAGSPVEPEEMEARIRALRGRSDAVVVEGAGGVAVPLAWGYTVLDLAARLSLPAVVVARPGLGTLNHVWLTVEALRARGIPIAAVVLNGAASPPDLAEATNPAALARMLPGVRCISIPRQETADPWEVASRLAPLLAGILDH